MDPIQHLIYEGISSHIPIGRLATNEAYETEIPIAFISCGRFDIFADVRTVSDATQYSKVGWGHMRVMVLPDGS